MPQTNNDVREVNAPNRLPDVAQELVREEVSEYRDLITPEVSPPVRIKLDPPIDYDGQGYAEVICDFEAMTGVDFRRCEREFTRLYKPDKNETPLPEMKHDYHVSLIVAASEKAGHAVPRGLVLKLPRRYYTPLRLEALKACGSSLEEEDQ